MRPLLLCALALATACAATTRPAASARATSSAQPIAFSGVQPLQMTLRGSSYTGTATLQRSGDSVTGTFAISGPGDVRGSVRGHVSASELTLELGYSVVQNGCTGTVRIAGPIAPGGSATGTAEALDSCVGRMTGTFKLGRP